jgi:hypothetical protein
MALTSLLGLENEAERDAIRGVRTAQGLRDAQSLLGVDRGSSAIST